MPELPQAKHKRLISEGLTADEATILIEDVALADYFTKAREHTQSKSLINWVLREIVNCIKASKTCPATCTVLPKKLAQLVDMVDSGKISNRAAQEVFETMAEAGGDQADIVKEKGLEQIDNTAELEKIAQEIVNSHPDKVAEYKSGKDKLFGFFVGQAMQKTKGKGNPQVIN